MKKVSKKILSLVICTMLIMSSMFSVFGATFNDVENHWAKETIDKWFAAGLVKGYDNDGTFRPDGKITRAEFVKMVNSAIQATASAKDNFSDVKGTEWYANDLAIAKLLYMDGYTDGTAKPGNQITRAEAAQILHNLMKLHTDDQSSVLSGFSDYNNIPEWSEDALNEVVKANYMQGNDNKLRAQDKITRAETLTMLDRVVGTLHTTSEEILDQTVEGNLTVTKNNTSVKNTTVKGDLYVTEGVGDGQVVLENTKVEGRTLVKGGGVNSFVVKGDSALGDVKVWKYNDEVRVALEGNAKASNVEILSGAKLSGHFTNVVLGEGCALVLEKGTVVDKMTVNANASISGSGTVKEMIVTGDGVNISGSVTVEKISAPVGVKVMFGDTEFVGTGKIETAPKVTAPSTGGGGGGGGSTVTEVRIVSALYVDNVTKSGITIDTKSNMSGLETIKDFAKTKDGTTIIDFSNKTVDELIIEYREIALDNAEKLVVNGKPVFNEKGLTDYGKELITKTTTGTGIEGVIVDFVNNMYNAPDYANYKNVLTMLENFDVSKLDTIRNNVKGKNPIITGVDPEVKMTVDGVEINDIDKIIQISMGYLIDNVSYMPANIVYEFVQNEKTVKLVITKN